MRAIENGNQHTASNSNQNWNKETCKFECENCRKCKKDCRSICKNAEYLKSIANTSVIACDKIISVMDILSTTMTDVIGIYASINRQNIEVRYKIDCYIFHTVL